MTNNRFSTPLLTVIMLCLLALVGKSWRGKTTVVHAAPVVSRPTYEYLTAIRTRNYSGFDGKYLEKVFLDGKQVELETEKTTLDILGSVGWELVAVEPRSDGGGSGFYASPGATSADVYIFKRIK